MLRRTDHRSIVRSFNKIRFAIIFILSFPILLSSEPMPDAELLLSPWIESALEDNQIAIDVLKRFGPESIRILEQKIKVHPDGVKSKRGRALIDQMCAVPRAISSKDISSDLPQPIWIKPGQYVGVELMEGQEEFRVWSQTLTRKMRFRWADGKRRDPIPGLSYANIIVSGHFLGDDAYKDRFVVIKDIDIVTDAGTGAVRLDVHCDRNTEAHLVEDQISDPNLTGRLVEFQRSGQGLTIRCLVRDQAGAPERILEELTMTGGGLSPIDGETTSAGLNKAFIHGDLLAVRRCLQRVLTGQMTVDMDGLGALITANRPMITYWATRVLARRGRTDVVVGRMLELLKGVNVPTYSGLIACYCGLIDDGAKESWDVALDPELFAKLCSTFNQFAGELIPDLIGNSLSPIEQARFRKEVITWNAEVDNRVRMMAWILSKSQGQENIDALILAFSRSKEDELKKLALDLLWRTIAIPASFQEGKRGGLGRQQFEQLESIWFRDPNVMLDWWKRNRDSLIWDARDGMYRLPKE